MNNKGFAVSGVLYTILLMFLALLSMLLWNFENKKSLLDKIKMEVNEVLNSQEYKVYANGYAVYFNPQTGKLCNENDAVSTTGTKTGCMKWYVFNDSKDSDSVNLILDHNTTAKIAWNSQGAHGTNVPYEQSNIKPEIDKLVSDSKWLEELTPRLIGADEINQITGKFDWNDWYCLESKTQDYSNDPWCNEAVTVSWLFDHTYCNIGNINYGCLNNDSATYGYWTKTPVKTIVSESAVWYVRLTGGLHNDYANSTEYGIRPVITILKEILDMPKICSIEPGTQFNFDYTGGEQEFEVPCSGKYKLETWGASGGNSYSTTYYGGSGGYSSGSILLNEYTLLFINVGGRGEDDMNGNASSLVTTTGGYNGGGIGYSRYSSAIYGAGGGGATHIAFSSGLLSTFDKKRDDVIIVAGSGGGGAYFTITANDHDYGGLGGSGGGYVGNSSYHVAITGYNATGGTQTAPGYINSNTSGSFGQGGNTICRGSCYGGGGGGGWYGGTGHNSYYTNGGSGGSGYIGNTLLTDKAMYCYNCTESNEESTKTISTTCTNASPTVNCSKQGNGYARITYLGK